MGHLGKKNLKKILRRFQQCWCQWPSALLAMLVLWGCSQDLGEPLQSGRVLPLQGMQGRWVGPVVPTESNCGKPTNGLMTIGRKGFGFDPFGSTSVIQGTVGPGGEMEGRMSREGGDHAKLSLDFHGTASGDTIDGELRSGRCRWTVTLRRG